MTMHSDAPIELFEQDLVDRGTLVRELNACVNAAPRGRGFVIGLVGPWGSGKTSIINLLEHEVGRERVVFWFEPWLFSGAEELVERFFTELATKLESSPSKQLRKVGQAAAAYGEALAPLVDLASTRLGVILRAMGKVANTKKSALVERERISGLLEGLDEPIVVFVDDLDRLEPRDVREVMRLVRLVGNLPNLVYVLAYDQGTIESSLKVAGIDDGASYLEKIVQVTVEVPPLPADRAGQLALQFLDEGVPESSLVAWNEEVWIDLFRNGIGPYFSTLRDARRFANSAPVAARLCADEVASMDVLALEAVRIFEPKLHAKLPEVASELVPDLSDWIPFDEDARRARSVERLDGLLAEAQDPTTARRVLAKLFPRLKDFLGESGPEIEPADPHAEKRVSAAPVWHHYVHRRLPDHEVPARVIDEALSSMAEAPRFMRVVAEIDGGLLPSFLARMLRQVDQVGDVDVEGCCVVLANAIPRVEGSYGPFSKAAYWQVADLIERLFDRFPEPVDRADLAAVVVREAPDLDTRAELFRRWSEPDEGPSGRPELDLVSGDLKQHLERELADEVMTADLAGNTNAYWMLEFVQKQEGQGAVLLKLREPGVLLATLRSYKTDLRPLTDGGEVFRLDKLVERAGGEVVEDVQSFLASCQELSNQERAGLRRALDQLDSDMAWSDETRSGDD